MRTGWFLTRDKAGLDIFWLRDESLEESDNLPIRTCPQEIVDDLEAALEQFREIAAQEVVGRMLEQAEIRSGDVLGKNKRIGGLLLTVIAN
jgi:hypothetical protein